MTDDFDRLCDLLREQEIVLWAGSGLSLYAGYPSGRELAKIILQYAETDEEREILNRHIESLMDISGEYAQMHSRTELFEIIKKTFDPNHVKDISIHTLISKIPQIKTIITTNYDKLFEMAYSNKLNIYKGTIFPKKNRKLPSLFKIHGDIDDCDSIVITNKDYSQFYEKIDSLMWNRLKPILAEKSILFVGYSIEDKNVEDIIEKVLRQINSSTEFFIVMPSIQDYKLRHFNSICKTTFIPMTGEDLVKKLEKRVRIDIIFDAIDSKVDCESAYSVCHNYGIDVSFRTIPNGSDSKIEVGGYIYNPFGKVITKGFKAKSNSMNSEEVRKFFEDCDCNEIEIPSSDTEFFREIEGIALPDKYEINGKKPDRVKLVKENQSFLTDVYGDNGLVLLNDVILQNQWGQLKSRTRIEAKSSFIEILNNNGSINIRIKITFPHKTCDLLKEMNVFQSWAFGNSLSFKLKENYSGKIVYKLHEIMTEPGVDGVQSFCNSIIDIYRKIQTIEDDIKMQFNITHDMTKEEINSILRAYNSLRPQIVKINGCIKIAKNDNTVRLTRTDSLIEPQKVVIEEIKVTLDSIVDIFGQSIIMGRRKITINDPIILDTDGQLDITHNKINSYQIISKTNEAVLEYVWNSDDQKKIDMYEKDRIK